MKQSERGNRKLRQLPKPCAEKAKDGETPKPASPVQEVWFDVDGEHRRLYAIRKNDDGKLLFFLDRAEVLELKGWPLPLPDTLSAADVQTVARMGGQTKGVYLILTRGGGSWGGYLLRRKYQDAERILIPGESEERDAAAHKRPAGAERHVPGTFWLSDADKAALDAATTPEGKARIMHGAELRGWMTPHEHEAWSTAKTDSDRQDIERKAAAAMRADIEAAKLRPLPGRACPDCGQLLVKAPYCDAWCPRPAGCGKLFGHKSVPAAKWGAKEDAYLASVEAWLAEPRTRSEIEAMLDSGSLGSAYKTFGYAPLAWTRGAAILRAELKKRDMEREGKAVERIGEKVRYMQSESGTDHHESAASVEVSEDGDAVFLSGQRRALNLKQRRILAHYRKLRRKAAYIRDVCGKLRYQATVNCKLSAIFREADIRDALFVQAEGKEEYRIRATVRFRKP